MSESRRFLFAMWDGGGNVPLRLSAWRDASSSAAIPFACSRIRRSPPRRERSAPSTRRGRVRLTARRAAPRTTSSKITNRAVLSR